MMTRRWFQFSLRTAIVAMVIGAVALGVYIRWPYYRAGRALDVAMGNKTFAAWPKARDVMINEKMFRTFIGYDKSTVDITIKSESRLVVKLTLVTAHFEIAKSWDVHIDPNGEAYLDPGPKAPREKDSGGSAAK